MILASFLLLAAASSACNAVDSATDLNPEGPPQVRQVFMTERIQGTTPRAVAALAFGEHEEFKAENPGDDSIVETATVNTSQRIRVVVDELLIGNYLEQIWCRDGSYQSVPEGATPDDIAHCAVAADLLPASCTGDYAVCFDAQGLPVGVMDMDENGSSDDTRFIAGSVRIACTPRDGGSAIDVPLNLTESFWQPSGNQQVPSSGGFNAIGPAVILAPLSGLPTNSVCTIVFDESVVDKDHNRVCASAGGSVDVECEPGNTDVVTFGSEVYAIAGSSPQPGSTTVTATPGTSQTITIIMNAAVPALPPADAVVVSHGGTNDTVEITRDAQDIAKLLVKVPAGYAAGTTYTVDYSNLTDSYGVHLPAGATTSFTFTTLP